MKSVYLSLLLSTVLHAQQPASEPHTFTSSDGRKLTASIISKTATTVTIRRAEDGQEFVLQLNRISAADQALVKAWGEKPPPPLVMADPALPESWVVPPKYESADNFVRLPGTSGFLFTTFQKENPSRLTINKRIGLIRSDGKVLCDPEMDESIPPFFLVKNGMTSGNHTANFFLFNRVFPKLSGGKYGLVDVNGGQVVPPQWEKAGMFSEGLFDVTISGKIGYANLEGAVVIQPQWAYAEPFSGGYAIVRVSKNGKRSVIDKTGKIISEAVWDEVRQLRVRRGGILMHDRPVFDFRPAVLSPGVFWVALNKKWGIYDIGKNAPMGEVQWDSPFADAHDFEHGKAWVRRDDKYGMIDLTGKVVLEPTWEGVRSGDGFVGSPTRVGNCIKSAKHGKTAWWFLDGTQALPEGDDVEWVDQYDGYFEHKIEGGKIIRVEKNFRHQEPDRTVLRRGGNSNKVGQMVGLADLDGKLLGEVHASWIYATPSSDYLKLRYHDPRCGLIDATGKVVEPPAQVVDLPLDELDISHPESLPDGLIVAAFKGVPEAGTTDVLFIQTTKGLVKVPWKAPAHTPKAATSVVTVKPHQKDGKWGYIRLIEAK